MPMLKPSQSATKGGPIVENYLDDDDAVPAPSKPKFSLSKRFTESSTSFKGLVLLLAAVALLAIAVALVLAVMIATGDGGNPTSPPNPAPVTNAPTDFPTKSPTAFPTVFPTVPTTGECETTTLNTEIRGDGDYIALVFPSCPSVASFNAFAAAARRWNDIIALNNILPFFVDFDVQISDFCGFPDTGYIFPAFYNFDHLVIFAETVDIDGVGGILGQAGPCIVDDGFKPVIGGMKFDNADLAGMEADGSILPVITHEMGHVLGIGSLFPFALQGGGQAADPSSALAQNLVFDPNTGIGNPNNHPFFTGLSATAELSTLSGATEPSVPLEDGRDFNGDLFFDVENGQGRGSIDSHWKYTRFVEELMTFQIDTSQPNHPLSAVSIASLEDMGYVVNLDKADPYELPFGKKNLRQPQERPSHILDLSGDVLTTAKDVKTMKDIVAHEAAKKKAVKPNA